MKWIIIDSDTARSNTLKEKLKSELQIEGEHIRFLNEKSMPETGTVYLIHNSDGYVGEFANKSKYLSDTYVIFYSGGGLSLSSLKATGSSIGFYNGVFQNGNEDDFFSLLKKAKEIIHGSLVNKKENFEKLFGFDPILEARLNFLHHCLTPTDLQRITWNDNGVVEIKTKSDDEKEKMERIGEIIDKDAKQFFEDLKQKTDGPFGENYIIALRALRDKLLQEY